MIQTPAFPYEEIKCRREGQILDSRIHRGISKRFYAACFAMQGILADTRGMSEDIYNQEGDISPTYVSKLAYKIADELIKQEGSIC